MGRLIFSLQGKVDCLLAQLNTILLIPSSFSDVNKELPAAAVSPLQQYLPIVTKLLKLIMRNRYSIHCCCCFSISLGYFVWTHRENRMWCDASAPYFRISWRGFRPIILTHSRYFDTTCKLCQMNSSDDNSKFPMWIYFGKSDAGLAWKVNPISNSLVPIVRTWFLQTISSSVLPQKVAKSSPYLQPVMLFENCIVILHLVY